MGEWRLYRAWGDLPQESGMWPRFLDWALGGWQHLLYVGITGRTTVARWAEHAADKQWAPDVAVWERDPRIWSTLADVEAAERAAIIAEQPVHNVAHNGNNPRAVTARRRHLPRHVVAARVRWAARACVWLALFAGLWLSGADAWRGWDGPRNSAVGASIILAAAWWWRASHSSRRRRTRKRARR